VVESLARNNEARVKFVEVDVGQDAVVAGRFGIAAIPTLASFKEGKLVDRYTGGDRRKLAAIVEGVA